MSTGAWLVFDVVLGVAVAAMVVAVAGHVVCGIDAGRALEALSLTRHAGRGEPEIHDLSAERRRRAGRAARRARRPQRPSGGRTVGEASERLRRHIQ